MKAYTDKTFGHPAEGVSYPDRIGAYLVLVRDGRVGVVRSLDSYSLPGGDAMGDESHEECILRECLRTIGYDVRIDELIVSADAYVTHPELGAYHPIQFYYSGELLDPLLDEDGSDGTPLAWIPLDRVDELLRCPMQAYAVRCYVGRETSAAALAFIDGKHEFYG
jgi:8-oxo-dGTP diphosphatase